MTEMAGPVLRGAETVLLRQDQETTTTGSLKKSRDQPVLSGAAAGLFETLRAERTRLAREQGVPAYIIFHDTTLAAIATARPTTLAALAEIPGMGQTKLDRYGTEILNVVAGTSPER